MTPSIRNVGAVLLVAALVGCGSSGTIDLMKSVASKPSGLPGTFSVVVLTSCGVPPTSCPTPSTTAELKPVPSGLMSNTSGVPSARTAPVSRAMAS